MLQKILDFISRRKRLIRLKRSRFWRGYFEALEDMWEFIGSLNLINFAIFDEVERIPDCTVEILRNSATGEISFGWYKGEIPVIGKGDTEDDE